MSSANFTHRLKHCPFCGEYVRVLVHDLQDQCYVECETCQSMGPTGGNVDSCVYQWNCRVADDNRERKCLKCNKALLQEREAGYRMCGVCRRSADSSMLPTDYGNSSDGNRQVQKKAV